PWRGGWGGGGWWWGGGWRGGFWVGAGINPCRPRRSPAIRSSLCRSTPRPRTTCRGFACSAFRRDRSKKNSKRCSSQANEETQQEAKVVDANAFLTVGFAAGGGAGVAALAKVGRQRHLALVDHRLPDFRSDDLRR